MSVPRGKPAIGLGVCTHAFPEQVDWWAAELKRLRDHVTPVISFAGPECPTLDVPVIGGPSLGVAHTKNRALDYLVSQGCDLILLCEDDCQFLDSAKLLEQFKEAYELGFQHLMLGPVTEWPRTWRYTGRKIGLGNLLFREYARLREPQDTPGVVTMVTREAIERAGGLNDRFIGRGHAHGEWTSRIEALAPGPLPSPFWHLETEGRIVYLDRQAQAPRTEEENRLIAANAALRSELESKPRAPNVSYLFSRTPKAHADPISVCMSLKNRAATLRQSLDSIKAWFEYDEQPNSLVIADFGSTDCDLRAELEARELNYKIVQLEGDFSRARGLHRAYAAAQNPVVFFLDADMLVPPHVGDIIRAHTAPRHCFFPICWSLREDGGGWWRDTGFGMVAMRKDDYDLCGGWNRNHRSWGAEDNDFHWHAEHRELKIRRHRAYGLVHQWHPPASGGGGWKAPNMRNAVLDPLPAIDVPTFMVRPSLDKWKFHLETIWQFQKNDTIPAEETAYFKGVYDYKREGGKNWAEVGVGNQVNQKSIERRVENFRALYRAIRDEGYDRSKEIVVNIGKTGDITVADGHHRSAISTVLGIPSIPARVRTRHPEWVEMRDMLHERFQADKLYVPVAHPDFGSWEAMRDLECRAQTVLKHIVPGSKVIDVGAHSGSIALALANAGCVVTAIEKSPKMVEAGKKLTNSMNRGKPIHWIKGDAWSQDVEKHDWIVCLSVLHHTCKDGTLPIAVEWLKAHGEKLILELADATESQMKHHEIARKQERMGEWLTKQFKMKATPILQGVIRSQRKSGSDRRWLWLLEH